MSPKSKQEELPTLDEVIDPDSATGRMISALDELNQLLDRMPAGQGLPATDIGTLQAELTEKLNKRVDELVQASSTALASRIKREIPAIVEQTLRQHLDDKKNGQ